MLWFVAHTKPRCEKKLADYCQLERIAVTLPCYDSVKEYRGKTVTFRKPLFPGYIFLRLHSQQVAILRQSKHVANLLDVFDQATFEHQLKDILRAIEANVGVRLAPRIQEGTRVRFRSGPLQGIEGLVERRSGMTTVLLRLDFINQAASVTVDADFLDLV